MNHAESHSLASLQSGRHWIDRLQLSPHPEGGHYREFYRSPLTVEGSAGQRSAVTIIHFLLQPGERSRWHVVQSDEIWRHSAGGPLELLDYSPETRSLTIHRLGSWTHADGSDDSMRPTHVIPAGHWQAARPLGGFTLVECTVAPGFDFADFHMVADLPDHLDHFAGQLAAHRDLL